MSSSRALHAGLIALMLAGCGFEPLYAERRGGSVVQELAAIEIAPIADRTGQLVHNYMTARTTLPGARPAPTHRLEIALKSSTEGFGFRSDEAVTRERIRMIAEFRLTDLETGQVVYADSARADTSVDVVQSDFATLTAEETATRRNAERVSDLILSRIALFLRANQN